MSRATTKPRAVAPTPRYVAIAREDWAAEIAHKTHTEGQCSECGAAVWVSDHATGRVVVCWKCHAG